MPGGTCETPVPSSLTSPRYSVVIPVYNSAPVVGATIAQTLAFFAGHGLSCEIVAVNDGSTDRSWDVLCDAARASMCVTAIDLADNYGQHTATFCGLARTTGDFVVTLDDDLQQPPDEIARLIEKAGEGHDLVCGRFRRSGAPVRQLGSWTIGLLDRWLFHKPRGFVFTSFRLMRRDVVDRLCDFRQRDPYLRGLLVLAASTPANVWVNHRPRPVGRSGYDAVKIARFGVRMLRTYWDLKRGGGQSPPAVIEIREIVEPGSIDSERLAPPTSS
jgi:glycosyltransferase involved in cell wall biosynthesis